MILKDLLNRSVRSYLMRVPITEGKKQLLRLTKHLIFPKESIVIFKTKYNFFLAVNLNNPEHQQMYFYGEHDERYEIKHIIKILRKGDICWDIGANIGFYTCLFASLVGETGKVVSFEPASKSMEFLAQNVAINSFRNLLLIKKALGDKKQEKELFYKVRNLAEGTASLKQSNKQTEFEIVEVDTIDNLSQTLPFPDFIKIDVEGYHIEVFEGGERFFRNHAPMVMAELEDDPKTLATMESYFRNIGYSRIYEFRKHGLHHCDSIVQSRNRNFLLLKENSNYFSRIQKFLI
jgi:FkbM family methyltransferase